MVSSIGIRLDAFALFTSLWLCGMFLLRRCYLAKVWAFYVAYLCFVLPLQYAMVMGIPPGLCTADFIQLLFACCQLYVFFLESSAGVHDGGSNGEIYDRKGCFVGQTPNPMSDFVTYRRSYLSTVKVFLFFPLYWITLAVMFLAGTNRVSIFAMGYVLGCFFFLWNGNEFYLKPMKVLLKMWNALLAYNVVVIFIKSILQMVGCVFFEYIDNYSCWLVQLFGIACLRKRRQEYSGWPERGTNANTEDGVCRVPLDEAGLLWDGICLTFLLVQKRLFTSYYFHHLIIEILAQQQLASRGAELINEMQVKGVQEQRAADKEIMEKIKRKMDKIRAAQQRVRGHEYGEPQTHFQALRSGDYYFFEDFADMDIDLEVETKKQKTDEEDADVKFRGLNALLTNAMRTRTIKGAQETARRGSQEFTEDYGELDATPLSTSHPAPTQISDTAVISSVEASRSGAVPSSNELFQAAPQVHPATETPTERTEQRNTEDEFLLASEAKRTLPNEDTLTDKVRKAIRDM
ncbi:piezo-type mechanosensitive ion channel component-like [Ixodes scapularis]|uniref:piezo-type mechanosensitive ion channel component-like n=1 Tax=Ixodes scapularis TaxID=6945 RepID=UPI001C385DF0|nr:piezo-type mechanosensitive ion channel component-like [Ixodes scapularis]